MRSRIAFVWSAGAAWLIAGGTVLAQEPPRGASFPQGECSGILCSTIGGSQAPQNQPRKSLFPEGECGGVLCNAIGGSQAPKHAEAPPACGGGLLCDVAPYAMGQPFIKPDEAERRRQAGPAAALAIPTAKVPAGHRKVKSRRQTTALR